MRTVYCKANYWSYKETEDNELYILLGGLTPEGKTVQVRIDDFKPHVYLELPKRLKWNKEKCTRLFEFFQQRYKSSGPLEMKLYKKKKLRYKTDVNVMQLSFHTDKAAKSFSNKTNKSTTYVYNLGSFRPGEFIVHESHGIDPIIKYTASRKLRLANWIKLKEYIPEEEEGLSVEERKFSTADVDLYCKFDEVYPVGEDEVFPNVQPKFCSFDIECYSENHNSKIPDPSNKKNEVFQIALIFGRFRQEENEWRKVLLTLFQPDDIEGSEVIRCKNERELLLKFRDLVEKENPDLFIGYNIMKFDWHYMIARAELLGFYTKFARLSRLIGERAERKEMTWGSSAYGEQTFNFLECHGRTNIDVMIEIERNYKLSSYGLNVVSERFLQQNKVDITPKQLFMMYRINKKMLHKLEEAQNEELPYFISEAADLLPKRQCHGIVKNVRRKILKSKTVRELRDNIRECIRITGVYCIQDTVLPIKLTEKLNIWLTMEGMANTMCVPASYLHTRGQQIKIVAQIYRNIIEKNIIFSDGNDPIEEYEGATVIEANAGDYDNVATLDFASLYPSVIEAHNICYTTRIRDDDPIPDSECNVIEGESHRGCIHDKKKRTSKIKKEKILCGKYKYRFRKITFHPDGTFEGEGILPEMERNLLGKRKSVKKLLFKKEARLKMQKGHATEKDIAFFRAKGIEIIEKGSLTKEEGESLEIECAVLDAEQKALKVSANSIYGGLGTKKGKLSLTAGAASITAESRRLIHSGVHYVINEYPKECKLDIVCKPKLVYGDSVTGDTPIMIRMRDNGYVNIVRIDELENYVEGEWHEHNLFKVYDSDLSLKNKIDVEELEVWTGSGWSKLNKIIRHKTGKSIWRVQTGNGVVNVTEDHSLLKEDGVMIKPKDVKIGDKLLTKFPEEFPNIVKSEISEEESKLKGLTCQDTIPSSIFNSSYRIRESFLDGWNQSEYLTDDSVTLQSIYYLNKSVGRNTLQDNDVRKIRKIHEKYNDYVYDLETEDGTFGAGVGELIVKNTDSGMILFEGTNSEQTFELAEDASALASFVLKCEIMKIDRYIKYGKKGKLLCDLEDKDLPDLTDEEKCVYYYYKYIPVEFEFENVYGRYLLLTMKRYVGQVVNRHGEVISTTKKGVVLARRDNCKFLRDTYKKVIDGILERKDEDYALDCIYERVNQLFTRSIPDEDLIIYVGVTNMMNYAKKKEITVGKNVERVYLDINNQPITGNITPDHPDLVFSNLPQARLALKMTLRGDVIPSNTRLEFLYTDLGYEVKHQGDKAEDYLYYKENKKYLDLRPDYLHYIEKQLMKPLTELLEVKYPHDWIPFETADEKLERTLKDFYKRNELYKSRLEKCKKVGTTKVIVSGKMEGERVYKFRGTAALVELGLQARHYKVSPLPSRETELIEALKSWKARSVLDRLYKQHKLTKRAKRVHQSGEKLKGGTKAIYWKEKEKVTIESLDIIKSEIEVESKSLAARMDRIMRIKKEEDVSFTISFHNGDIISGVKRGEISPMYRRDSTIIKDILSYRKGYKEVVKSLNDLFTPVTF